MDNNHAKLSAQGQIRYILEINTNLRFISSLQPGDKFYTSDRSICKPSFYSRVVRSFSGENRELIFRYVDRHVTDAISFIESVSPEDKSVLNEYMKDTVDCLIAVLTGLESLKQTYDGDRIFCLRLDSIATVIDKVISRHSEHTEKTEKTENMSKKNNEHTEDKEPLPKSKGRGRPPTPPPRD